MRPSFEQEVAPGNDKTFDYDGYAVGAARGDFNPYTCINYRELCRAIALILLSLTDKTASRHDDNKMAGALSIAEIRNKTQIR